MLSILRGLELFPILSKIRSTNLSRNLKSARLRRLQPAAKILLNSNRILSESNTVGFFCRRLGEYSEATERFSFPLFTYVCLPLK